MLRTYLGPDRLLAALGCAGAVHDPPPRPEHAGAADTIPEKIGPQEPAVTGSTGAAPAERKLERSDGVIRPPAESARNDGGRPVPNPRTTPVIPPPGSPGGDPTLDPKHESAQQVEAERRVGRTGGVTRAQIDGPRRRRRASGR